MMPRRVVFAANATTSTGAGHVMRLIEISKAFPSSIKKEFIGSVDLPWIEELLGQYFPTRSNMIANDFGRQTIIIVDSYDNVFCQEVAKLSLDSTIVQIADRYTTLLPKSLIVFMDLPFNDISGQIIKRTIAHGIQYIPARSFKLPNAEVQPRAKRVLVTTGGSANSSIFLPLIDEFTKTIYREINFDFIGMHGNYFQTNRNFHFYQIGAGFDTIARSCDTAISAAGTTMWSLLANNLVLGLAAIVENQKANYSYAISSKHALPLFDVDNKKLDFGVLRTLLFDEKVRQNLHMEISGKYDTLGARRVCDVILDTYQKNL